jgi:hypothetical protein
MYLSFLFFRSFALMQKNQKIKAVRRGGSNKLKFWFFAAANRERYKTVPEKGLVVAFKKLHEPKFLNAI